MIFALLAVVVCAVISSYVANHQTATEDVSDKTDKLLTAYQDTKLAVLTQPLAGLESRLINPTTSNLTTPKSRVSSGDNVIRDWQALTVGKEAKASDWRHYGLALAMYGRPGAEDALLHATTIRNIDANTTKLHSLISRQVQFQESSVRAEVERNVWVTLFGDAPISGPQAVALQDSISKLKLGWFEKVALAKLYRREGSTGKTQMEISEIRNSSGTLLLADAVYGILILCGCVAILGFGLVEFVKRLDASAPAQAVELRTRNRPTSSASPRGVPVVPPLPPNIDQARSASLTQSSEAPTDIDNDYAIEDRKREFNYSYRARTISFVVYLSTFLLVGALLRLLRNPLNPLNVTLLLHISLSLSIVLLIPGVLNALVVLRKLAAAESPGRLVPSWRHLLYNLGCRTNHPLADIGAGIVSYMMMLPVMALGAYVSLSFFKFCHIKTPEHPLNYQMVLATDPLSQWLLFLVAAVAAPIVEELMFRGLLYPALRYRYGVATGVALSGAIFAIIHPNMPSGFLPLWVIGAWFAATFERRRSLLTTMTMHALHNGLAVSIMMATISR